MCERKNFYKKKLLIDSPARFDAWKAVVWEKRNQNAHGDADLIQADLKNTLVMATAQRINTEAGRNYAKCYLFLW